MRKLILFMFIFLSIPFVLNAEEYIPEKLEDSLKAEGISYDFKNFEYSDDKVNVYLFRGQGCGHCEHFLEFVSDTLVKDYSDYFNFIGYETWRNSANESLMQKVKDYLNVSSKGVPFIVIGDKYFVGYGESRNEAIISLIKSEYENSTRVDLIKKFAYGDESVSNDVIFSNNEDKSVSDNSDIKATGKDSLSESDNNSKNNLNIEFFIIILVIFVSLIVLVYVIYYYIKLKKRN